MHNENLVSVIIPTYNTGPFLLEAIESVLNQTHQNFELLIVDDGSAQNLQRELDKYLLDSRVTYIRKENSGVSDTRNVGAGRSKGKYLCFLDADDLFLDTNLEQKLKYLQQYPSVPLVHGNVQVINEQGNPTGETYEGLGGHVLQSLLLWKRTVIPAPSSIMIERQVFFEIGQWDTNFSTAADQEFFFRLAAKYPVGHIPAILTKYRVVAGSMSRNIARMEKDHIAVYKKAEQQGLFKSSHFRNKCFAQLYIILGGSWFKDGGNKGRGLFFLIKAVLVYPPSIVRLLKKLI